MMSIQGEGPLKAVEFIVAAVNVVAVTVVALNDVALSGPAIVCKELPGGFVTTAFGGNGGVGRVVIGIAVFKLNIGEMA